MKTLKPFLLYVATALFFFSSCKDDEGDPEPGVCSLSKITTEENGQSSSVTLTYDSNGRLATIQDEDLEGTLEYNAAGKPIRINLSDSPFGAGKIEYTYNAQGKISKYEFFTSFLPTPIFRSTITYNANGQLSKIVNQELNSASFLLAFSDYSTYTVDAAGNITQEKYYEGSSENTATLQRTFDYTYDDGINSAADLQMLLNGYSTPNNAKTIVTKDASGSVDPDASSSIVYTYNSSKYPTKAVTTTQANVTSTVNMDYVCK